MPGAPGTSDHPEAFYWHATTELKLTSDKRTLRERTGERNPNLPPDMRPCGQLGQRPPEEQE